MSSTISNPTTPVSTPARHRLPPPSPASQRKLLPGSDGTRIPQPAVPMLRRSLSMRARSTSHSSTTRQRSDLADSFYAGDIISSKLHSFDITTENHTKSIQRSPIGASCPAINKKGLPNAAAGNHNSSHAKHREHGMVNIAYIFVLFYLAWGRGFGVFTCAISNY